MENQCIRNSNKHMTNFLDNKQFTTKILYFKAHHSCKILPEKCKEKMLIQFVGKPLKKFKTLYGICMKKITNFMLTKCPLIRTKS